MNKPRLLNGCAKSKFIADAFEAKGWEAWTCDILPAEGLGNHIQDDVLKHLNDGWDMAIFHPPCTYLSNAGLHYLSTSITRQGELDKAAKFVIDLWMCPIPRIAIENPVGWLNTHWRPPDQIIQPYYFGHDTLKTTCLWLKGLPPLFVEKWLERPKSSGMCVRKTGKKAGQVYRYYHHEGKDAEGRARTFPGIAQAMANQWGAISPVGEVKS